MRNSLDQFIMKRQILILILIVQSSIVVANSIGVDLAKDSIRTNFRVSLPLLDFGFGTTSNRLTGNLPKESNLILSEYSNKNGHIGMGIQFLFFDLVGIETGIEINLGNVNEMNVRNAFQSHFQNYTVEILPNNYESGPFPFETKLDFASIRGGLFSAIRFDKFWILPSINYYRSIYEDYPTLGVNLTENSTGTQFVRNYFYKNITTNGLKTGVAFRLTGNSAKIVNPFFQLKAEFIYYKSEGTGYYTEAPLSGSGLVSQDYFFTQNNFGLLISLNAGLDFRCRAK